MAKIKRGYTRKEPYIGKTTTPKDIPVLTNKMPDRPRRSKRGSKYSKTTLAKFHTGERMIANAENKPKRTGWSRFFRGGGGGRSAGQPLIGMRQGKIRKEPKLQ